MRMNPGMNSQEFFEYVRLMGLDVIPQQHDHPRNVSKQMAEKLNHLLCLDILIRMELQKEIHPSPFGRSADGRDSGDLSPSSGNADQRCLPFRRPTSHDQRNHEKSAFIEENQMGFKPVGVFLYAATRIASNVESPYRPARGLSTPAFYNSNPFPPKTSTP